MKELTRRTFIASLISIPVIAGIVQTEPVKRDGYCCELCDFDPFEAHGTQINHWSDCATHNEPAYPNGPCDCFHVGARIEDVTTGLKAEVIETTDKGIKWKALEHGFKGIEYFEGFKNWRRI